MFVNPKEIKRINAINVNELKHGMDATIRNPNEIMRHYATYCPQCGAELIGHSCKLRCHKCHYFRDCGDIV